MKKVTKVILTLCLVSVLCFAIVGVAKTQTSVSAETPTANDSAISDAKQADKYQKLEFGVAMNYQNPDWGGDMVTNDKAIVALSIPSASDVSFKTGDYDVAGKYYVYVSDNVDEEGSDKASGIYGVANRGGNGWVVLNLNCTKKFKRITLKKGFYIKSNKNGVLYALEDDYVLYNVSGVYLHAKSFAEAMTVAQSSGVTVSSVELKLSSLSKIDSQKEMFFNYDGTTIASGTGAIAYMDTDLIVGSKGGKLTTYGGYVDSSNTKRIKIRNAVSTFQDKEKITIPAGFSIAFWYNNNQEVKIVKTTEDFVCWYSDGEFTTTDPSMGTREWYLDNASKVNDLEFNFVMPYANPDWGLSAKSGVTAFSIKGASNVDFTASNIKTILAKGYVYTSDNVDEIGSDKGSGVSCYATRGGNGWLVLDLGVQDKPARVTLKAGLIIVMNDNSVYDLKQDCVLYNVDGAYILGKTFEEALTNSGVKVVSIQKELTNFSFVNDPDGFMAVAKFDGKLQGDDEVLFPGSIGYVSYSSVVGKNGGTISGFGGYVDTSTEKSIKYRRITTTIQDDEQVTVKAGFTTAFWSSDKTFVYVVKTTNDYTFLYESYSTRTRDWYISKAQESGNHYIHTDAEYAGTKTGWMKPDSKAIVLKMQGLEAGTSFAEAYAFISSNGYVKIDGELKEGEVTQWKRADSNNLVKDDKLIGLDLSAFIGDTKPTTITLCAGFMVAVKIDDVWSVAELAHDCTIYNVDGYYVSIQDIESLKDGDVIGGKTVKYKTFTADSWSISDDENSKGINVLMINTWKDAEFIPNKTSYPGGAATWVNSGKILCNGVAIDDVWYAQYQGDSGFRFCSTKENQLSCMNTLPIPEGEEYGTVTFKAGLKILFFDAKDAWTGEPIIEVWELKEDLVGYYDSDGYAYDRNPDDEGGGGLIIDEESDSYSEHTSHTEPTPTKGGCMGEIGSSFVMILAVATVLVVLNRKKEN